MAEYTGMNTDNSRHSSFIIIHICPFPSTLVKSMQYNIYIHLLLITRKPIVESDTNIYALLHSNNLTEGWEVGSVRQALTFYSLLFTIVYWDWSGDFHVSRMFVIFTKWKFVWSSWEFVGSIFGFPRPRCSGWSFPSAGSLGLFHSDWLELWIIWLSTWNKN